MIEWVHPGVILIVGAFIIPFLKGRWRKAYLLIPPVLAFIDLILMYMGVFGDIPASRWQLPFLGYELVFGRVDKLSLLFGLAFSLASVPVVLYGLNIKSSSELMSEFIYAGSSIGAVFAGDLITLYIFWEIMAITALLVILHGGTDRALGAGYRYILWHVAGGVILLAGIVMYIAGTGSIAFNAIGWSSPDLLLPSLLIFVGFIINAGAPPLHAWLPDSYPESTYAGSVYLSIFTTKTAVYVLARGFAGFGPLMWIGAFMTIYPIFYAVLENDLRKVLSYSIINQVGFMLCGIGIGTALAINGAVSHAFVHILYKGLLFMSIGSVLYRTGTTKITELGGLYKSMPITCICCVVGAASISAFPLFSGFTTKSMTIDAALAGNFALIFVLLQLAGAGVFEHAGIKVPFMTFFSEDRGIRVRDPPINMQIAMGTIAFLCILLGVYPHPLYQILPYSIDYVPYTTPHVVGQLQLLLFASFAFYVLMLSGIYPPERRTISLDTDWPLRMIGAKFMWFVKGPLMALGANLDQGLKRIASFFKGYGGELEERMLVGVSVLIALIFLAVYLLVELIYRWAIS
ncbi:MAG: Na(+)/H(+) antiporter subunit D [Methanotrichaceae archaeon]|nr:Na(+)/H(+) antiporter subunit D [Methanotrichaceae archaeon]